MCGCIRGARGKVCAVPLDHAHCQTERHCHNLQNHLWSAGGDYIAFDQLHIQARALARCWSRSINKAGLLDKTLYNRSAQGPDWPGVSRSNTTHHGSAHVSQALLIWRKFTVPSRFVFSFRLVLPVIQFSVFAVASYWHSSVARVLGSSISGWRSCIRIIILR